MANEEKNYIVSPVGQVDYLKVKGYDKSKYKKYPATDRTGNVHPKAGQPMEYQSVRLRFKDTDPGVAEFKKQIKTVNSALIGPKDRDASDVPEGYFTVAAKTTFEVALSDETGTLYEGDRPEWTKGSTGRALMKVSTFGTPSGGGLNLLEVSILELDVAEKQNNREDILEALAKAQKG